MTISYDVETIAQCYLGSWHVLLSFYLDFKKIWRRPTPISFVSAWVEKTMQLCPDIRFRIHNFASRHIRKVSLFPMFCNLISSWYLYNSRRSPSINLRISYGHGLDIKVGNITTCLPGKVWNRNEPTRWLPTHHLAEPFDSAHLWTRLRTCACHLSSRLVMPIYRYIVSYRKTR